MKIEIELSDRQVKQLITDVERLGYKVLDKEKLMLRIIDDLFDQPLAELMGYDQSSLGDSDEAEDLLEWGCESVEKEHEDYDDEEP